MLTTDTEINLSFIQLLKRYNLPFYKFTAQSCKLQDEIERDFFYEMRYLFSKEDTKTKLKGILDNLRY